MLSFVEETIMVGGWGHWIYSEGDPPYANKVNDIRQWSCSCHDMAEILQTWR